MAAGAVEGTGHLQQEIFNEIGLYPNSRIGL
jgi:hypothetical protein